MLDRSTAHARCRDLPTRSLDIAAPPLVSLDLRVSTQR